MSHKSVPQTTTSASPQAGPARGWQRAKFILKAIEVRMRFIAVLVGLGLVIAYWSTIQNYWDHWTRPSTVADADSDVEYFCPMHPQVVRAQLDPGGKLPNCPICGMPLSKRIKGEKPKLPDGVLSRVELSPERVSMAGVRTETVQYRPLTSEIRAVGFVDYDESKLSRIVARVKGFIEKLYVDKSFTTVEQGQPLAELYSPELYSSVQELLIAKKYKDGALLAGGRERLRLFGVDDQEIDQLLSQTQAHPRIMLRSPRTGHVIGKDIVVGAAVEPGMTLFEVADLSTVWIEAEVFEKDLSLLRKGQSVEATVDALPGERFQGEVNLIHPHLEAATRTNRVRLVLDNSDHKLRPGMFATVTIRTPLDSEPDTADQLTQPAASSNETPEVLAVPQQAVIDTGTKKMVYVERQPGVFDGIEVTLGPRSGDYYTVLSGLSAGDKVAAAGAFLIDAETRLNPGAAGAYFGASGSGGSDKSSSTTTVGTAGTEGEIKLTPEELQNIRKLPPAEADAAAKQAVCPITGNHLGSMGPPEKISLDGHDVFLCCPGCKEEAIQKKDEVLRKLGVVK